MSNRRGKKRGTSLVMSVLALVFVMVAVTQAGQSGVDTRIHKGTEAGRGEFPFLACLYKMKEKEWALQCGGSILDEHHILTAAHCIPTSDQKMVAKLGCHEQSNCTNAYKISARLIHPNYYRFDGSGSNDDIAILRTEKPIEMTGPIGQGSVGLIELPKRDDLTVGEILTVAGWGATSDHSRLPDVPMKANLTTERCENSRRYDSIICSNWDIVHACGGDSGGPLFRTSGGNRVDGHMTLLGIVSSGEEKECEVINKGYYTRVASYLDWVEHSISYSEWWAPQLTA